MTQTPKPLRRPGVRCPHCGTKLAEWLHGEAGFTCRKCGKAITLQQRITTVEPPKKAA